MNRIRLFRIIHVLVRAYKAFYPNDFEQVGRSAGVRYALKPAMATLRFHNDGISIGKNGKLAGNDEKRVDRNGLDVGLHNEPRSRARLFAGAHEDQAK